MSATHGYLRALPLPQSASSFSYVTLGGRKAIAKNGEIAEAENLLDRTRSFQRRDERVGRAATLAQVPNHRKYWELLLTSSAVGK